MLKIYNLDTSCCDEAGGLCPFVCYRCCFPGNIPLVQADETALTQKSLY